MAYKDESLLAYSIKVIVIVLGILLIYQINADSLYAQDEDYYQEVEDNYHDPQNDDSIGDESFADTDPEPIDPEFTEEIEPGEFNQSDDVTELNDTYSDD